MLSQTDLMDIFRTFYPKATEYTFFSSAHETFSKIDCMFSHKTSLNKFERIEVISSIFFNHNGRKLKSNFMEKKTGKFTCVEIKQHGTEQLMHQRGGNP